MTVRLQYHRECDRCAHPFESAVLHDDEALPERTGPRLRLLKDDDVCFDWRDLCPACVKVVSGLIDRLRLTAPPKKKEASVIVEPLPPEETTPSTVSDPEAVI